jgi:hypothetical protein
MAYLYAAKRAGLVKRRRYWPIAESTLRILRTLLN